MTKYINTGKKSGVTTQVSQVSIISSNKNF